MGKFNLLFLWLNYWGSRCLAQKPESLARILLTKSAHPSSKLEALVFWRHKGMSQVFYTCDMATNAPFKFET